MLPQAVSRGGRTIWISLNLFSLYGTKTHYLCLIFDKRKWHFASFFWFFWTTFTIWEEAYDLYSVVPSTFLHVCCMCGKIYVFTCRQERRARGTHSFAWSSAELKNWCSSSRNVGEQWARAERLQILLLCCTSFHFPFRKHWNCCQLLT